jgi:small subunit ribosomal protein S1
MLYKKESQILAEDQSAFPDEGWWASVLAEEEIYQSCDVPAKITPPVAQTKIDWDRIKSLYDQDEVVPLRVQGYNRGGLLVEGDDLQGFVPISHLLEMPPDISDDQKQLILANYVGRLLNLKIIECEESQERVVFSERAAVAGQGRRKYLFNSIKSGDEVYGTITNITDFGVFVDLGGLEGLIHVSELSWGRVQHPGDIVKVGQNVTAQVLQISPENARVALSLKRLLPNPWESIAVNHRPGEIVPAEITGIARFGIFARLDEGVEGLIHISSLNLQSGYDSLDEEFFTGQKIRVRILQIDPEKKRLGLTLVSNE